VIVLAAPLLLGSGDGVLKELQSLQRKWKTVGGEAARKTFAKGEIRFIAPEPTSLPDRRLSRNLAASRSGSNELAAMS
jgi:hypothetical protein